MIIRLSSFVLNLNCWLKLINIVITIKIMSYSFEYIDIILLAMIAGFIFLRLRITDLGLANECLISIADCQQIHLGNMADLNL